MPFKNILEKAKLNNTLVSVYIDSDDWNLYSVGYVDLVTDIHIRLRAVSKSGDFAGYELRKLSEIIKVELEGKYEKKIKKLNNNQGKIFNEIGPNKKSSGNLILDALQQSLAGLILIAVWGNDPDDSLVGYVEKLEDDLISLRLINEFGEDDGVSTICFDEITSLDFNTQSEQVRTFLHKDLQLMGCAAEQGQ